MNNKLQWHPSVMGAECSFRTWRDDCEEKQREAQGAKNKSTGAQAQGGVLGGQGETGDPGK